MPREKESSPGKRAALTAVEIAMREGVLELQRQFPKKPESMTEKPVIIIDADVQETEVSIPDDSHLPANEEPLTNGKKDEEEKPPRKGRRRERKVRSDVIQPTQEGRKTVGAKSEPVPLPEEPELALEKPVLKEPAKTRKKPATSKESPAKKPKIGEAEKRREEERQSLINQIQERDAKPRESAKFAGLEPEDPDNEAGFAQRKRDQWSLEEEKEADKSEQGETVVAERLKEAEEEVALARRQFIKEDFNKTSSWNKVKSFFRLTSEDSALGANSDVESYHEIYTEKLLLLQDLQFQAIKESGVTGEKLKEAFAGTLRYFKYDEAVRLYQARTDVRRDNMHWGDKVAGVFENIGKEYNKLSLTKKLALSAVLIGGSFATGGASLLAKRLLSGAGTFVGVEGLLEKLAEKKGLSQAQKEIVQQMSEGGLYLAAVSGNQEELESRLQQIIREDINALDSKLQKNKRDALLRKGMALGIGVGIGSGAFSQLVMEHLGGQETLQAAGTYVKDHLGGEAISQAVGTYAEELMGAVPDEGVPEVEAPPASAPAIEFTDTARDEFGQVSEAPVQPIPGADTQNPIGGASEVPDTVPTEQETLIADIEKTLASSGSGASSSATVEYAPAAAEELAREVLLEDGGRNFLQDYDLTRADGPRGLWGVLESRLPTGLPEAQENAMIQKLENVIAERLAEMTPEQQAAAGFRGGDINKIYAGETLKFSALLMPEDVGNIVGEEALPSGGVIVPDASEVPNSPGSSVTEAIVPDSETPNIGGSDGNTSGGSPEAAYSDNPAPADMQYERDMMLGKEYNLPLYKEYFKLNKEALPLFRESGTEYMNFISQDNPAMMRSIGDKTFAVLDRSALKNTSLEQFIKLARQTYGNNLGVPSPKEKVYEYVMRMAMLSVEHPTHKQIPLPRLFSV